MKLTDQELAALQSAVDIYRESGATGEDVAIEIGVDALASMLEEIRMCRAGEAKT